jgi:predicted transcriptional regulator
MEKALKIINEMSTQRFEFAAIDDLRSDVKKLSAKASEVEAFVSKFKQLKQEYDKMESTRATLVKEAQSVSGKSGISVDAVGRDAAALGVDGRSIKEVQQWQSANLELLGAVQNLINLGK